MQEEERIELDRENKMMTHECEYIQRERTRKRVSLQSIALRNFQALDRDVLWQYREIEEADTENPQDQIYDETRSKLVRKMTDRADEAQKVSWNERLR